MGVFYAADGRLEIDTINQKLVADGREIKSIKPAEMRFLGRLAIDIDSVVDKSELAKAVTGYDDPSAQKQVRSYVHSTRNKLPEDLRDGHAGAIRTSRLLEGYGLVSSLDVDLKSVTKGIAYLADGRVQVDHASLMIYRERQPLEELTPAQRRLFSFLARNPDRWLRHLTLRRQLHTTERVASQFSLRTHASRIHKALGPTLGDAHNGVLRTNRKYGYGVVSSLKIKDLRLEEIEPVLAIASSRLVIDPNRRTVKVDGKTIRLADRQFDILYLLSQNTDQAIDPIDINKQVGAGRGTSPYVNVKVHIYRLRQSLGNELGHPTTGAIVTEVGKGYKAMSELAV